MNSTQFEAAGRWGILAPLVALLALAAAALTMLRLGSVPIILREDVVLHGGFSFILVFGGMLAVRSGVGMLAKVPEWCIFVFVLGLGIGLEVAQYYWRVDSTVGDVAIDSVGGLAGWAFWHLVLGLKARMRRRWSP